MFKIPKSFSDGYYWARALPLGLAFFIFLGSSCRDRSIDHTDAVLLSEQPEEQKSVDNDFYRKAFSLNASPSDENLSAADASDKFLFSFVVLGDSRLSSGWAGYRYPSNYVRTLSERLTKIQPKPDFVVFLGDMVTYVEPAAIIPFSKGHWLEGWFEDFYSPLKSNGIALYPVMGNHETYDATSPLHTKTFGKAIWSEEAFDYSLNVFDSHLEKQRELMATPVSYLGDWTCPELVDT